MRFDIVSFGSGILDIIIEDKISEKDNCIFFHSGDKILLDKIRMDIGGGGTNTAVAFSRLGLKTGWIGKISDDFYGRKILSSVKEEKVKFLGKVEKRGISGFSFILDSNKNNRTILTYKGSNNDIDLKELNLRKIKTEWLYYSSLLGKSFETQKKLIKLKKMYGTKLAFNPSSYLIEQKNILSLLKLSDILILNKEEAMIIAKKYKSYNLDLLRSLSSLGPKIVVITDKDKLIKCYDKLSNNEYSIMPHKIRVKERTGAGDAFASGFTAGIIKNKSIKECLKLGLKESESVIKYFGAKNKLLRMKLR